MKKLLYLYIFLMLSIDPAYSLSHKNLEKEVEIYLNSIKSLSSSFVQQSGHVTSSGFIKIKKPGKARIDYNSPEKLVLILKHDRVIYYNFDLEEYANLPQNSNFLFLLASQEFDFSKFSAHKVEQSGNQIIANIEIGDKGLAEGGMHVKLIFDISVNDKLSINSIIINDFISDITTFKLVNPRYDVDISDKEFLFKHPSFFKK